MVGNWELGRNLDKFLGKAIWVFICHSVSGSGLVKFPIFSWREGVGGDGHGMLREIDLKNETFPVWLT